MIQKAKNLMVRVNGKTIALATSCSLNVSITTLDARTKSSNGAVDIIADTAWTISTNHLVGYNPNTSQLAIRNVLDYILNNPLVDVEFCTVVDSPSGVPTSDWQVDEEPLMPWLFGKALVKSAAISAEAVGNAYMTIELIGQGPLNIRA